MLPEFQIIMDKMIEESTKITAATKEIEFNLPLLEEVVGFISKYANPAESHTPKVKKQQHGRTTKNTRIDSTEEESETNAITEEMHTQHAKNAQKNIQLLNEVQHSAFYRNLLIQFFGLLKATIDLHYEHSRNAEQASQRLPIDKTLIDELSLKIESERNAIKLGKFINSFYLGELIEQEIVMFSRSFLNQTETTIISRKQYNQLQTLSPLLQLQQNFLIPGDLFEKCNKATRNLLEKLLHHFTADEITPIKLEHQITKEDLTEIKLPEIPTRDAPSRRSPTPSRPNINGSSGSTSTKTLSSKNTSHNSLDESHTGQSRPKRVSNSNVLVVRHWDFVKNASYDSIEESYYCAYKKTKAESRNEDKDLSKEMKDEIINKLKSYYNPKSVSLLPRFPIASDRKEIVKTLISAIESANSQSELLEHLLSTQSNILEQDYESDFNIKASAASKAPNVSFFIRNTSKSGSRLMTLLVEETAKLKAVTPSNESLAHIQSMLNTIDYRTSILIDKGKLPKLFNKRFPLSVLDATDREKIKNISIENTNLSPDLLKILSKFKNPARYKANSFSFSESQLLKAFLEQNGLTEISEKILNIKDEKNLPYEPFLLVKEQPLVEISKKLKEKIAFIEESKTSSRLATGLLNALKATANQIDILSARIPQANPTFSQYS